LHAGLQSAHPALTSALLPVPNRDRFPLDNFHSPLTRAHHAVKCMSKDGKDGFKRDFTARGVGWSRDGKWCIVAGETWDNVSSTVEGKGTVERVKVGGAVVLGKDMP
jgi:hypothetical protein